MKGCCAILAMTSDNPAYIVHKESLSASRWRLAILHPDLGLIQAYGRNGKAVHKPALFMPYWFSLKSQTQYWQVEQSERFETPVLLWPNHATLAGFALNELILRYCPRSESVPSVFAYYRYALNALGEAQQNDILPLICSMQMLLLDTLGTLPNVHLDAHGECILQDKEYQFFPKQGFVAGKPGLAGTTLMAIAERDFSLRKTCLAALRIFKHELDDYYPVDKLRCLDFVY